MNINDNIEQSESQKYEWLKELRDELREVRAADVASAKHLGKAEAMVIALTSEPKTALLDEIYKWGKSETYDLLQGRNLVVRDYRNEEVASKKFGRELLGRVFFDGYVRLTPLNNWQINVDVTIDLIEADGTTTEVTKNRITT